MFGRVLMLFLMMIFVVFMLSIGNRRDFVPVLLFSIGVYASRRVKGVDFRQILIMVSLALGMSWLESVRYQNGDELDTVSQKIGNSEFSYPVRTLVYYVNNDKHDLGLGKTYLMFPLLFIPRNIWADKPKSLGTQFVIDAFGTDDYQGFAFTPNTESFLNFGYIGPIMVMTFIALLFVFLIGCKRVSRIYYFIVFKKIGNDPHSCETFRKSPI